MGLQRWLGCSFGVPDAEAVPGRLLGKLWLCRCQETVCRERSCCYRLTVPVQGCREQQKCFKFSCTNPNYLQTDTNVPQSLGCSGERLQRSCDFGLG